MWMLEAVPLGADPFGRSCQCGQEDHHDVIHGLDELVRLSVVVVKVPPVVDNTRTLLDIVDAHEPSEVGRRLVRSNDMLHNANSVPSNLKFPWLSRLRDMSNSRGTPYSMLTSRLSVIRSVSTPHDGAPVRLTHQLVHQGPEEVALVSDCPLPVPQFTIRVIDQVWVNCGIMDVLTQLRRHHDLRQRLFSVGPDHLRPRDSRS
mmetsp:Transcript_8386/g.23864  ORF Transcript_8386/g.23864 Transcript_8386/m.23864 type:complete len:203 (-) Transcript_8386:511-1119(-)